MNYRVAGFFEIRPAARISPRHFKKPENVHAIFMACSSVPEPPVIYAGQKKYVFLTRSGPRPATGASPVAMTLQGQSGFPMKIA
jgi:hypothetical protein